MTFEDEGIIVDVKPQGEKQAIVSLLTKEHGLHKGMITVSKANSAYLQSGVKLKATWSARLIDHLGTWQIDPIYTPLPFVLHNKLALLALTCACELLMVTMPEREPHPSLFQSLDDFIHGFENHAWYHRYCYFECELLRSLALPLNFSACAVTGGKESLCYVSPKTGRAVSRSAAEGYESKLIPLPFFLTHKDMNQTPAVKEIIQALTLTSYFMERFVLAHIQKSMPKLRENLVKQLEMNVA